MGRSEVLKSVVKWTEV